MTFQEFSNVVVAVQRILGLIHTDLHQNCKNNQLFTIKIILYYNYDWKWFKIIENSSKYEMKIFYKIKFLIYNISYYWSFLLLL